MNVQARQQAIANCIAVFVAVFFVSDVLLATVIHVPDDQPTIQAGLNSAAEGDTVLVSPGIYYENIFWPETNGIRLIGSGYEDCIIDGNDLAGVISFSWELGGIIDINTEISGFTLRNGRAAGSAPNDRGGGISCFLASPYIHDLSIENCTALTRGGGLHCEALSAPHILRVILSENQAPEGGGVYLSANCNLFMNDVVLMANAAEQNGGGLYCDNTDPLLDDVTILSNFAGTAGGGIALSYSDPELNGVTIIGNSALIGGGLHCFGSTPSLTATVIICNSALHNGGGIYFNDNAGALFADDDRCNLYGNDILQNRGYGAELFAVDCDLIAVIVDTFSVLTPTSYHASPIDNFSFDILHGSYELIDADLYVAVDGDNSNPGTSPETPLKTIQYALSRISDGNRVHLAEGIYSPSTTGESFPIRWSNQVDLIGAGIDESILDAEQTGTVLEFEHISNANIQDLSLRNGFAQYGGGVYCISSHPQLQQVTISGNQVQLCGGGIYCRDSNPELSDVICESNAAFLGGGLYCENSHPNIQGSSFLSNSSANEQGYGMGGGVYCVDSSPMFLDVTIGHNHAGWAGGGVFLEMSSPAFQSVYIYANSGVSWGGGIYSSHSSPSLNDVTIEYCLTYHGGGAICCWGNSSPTLNDVYLVGNIACDGGGSLYSQDSELSIDGLTIIDSEAYNGYGGGIAVLTSTLNLSNALIVGNHGYIGGGGIYCQSVTDMHLTNVTLTDNRTSTEGGGAVYCANETSVSLENCILWDNTPDQFSFYELWLPSTLTVACSDIEEGEDGIEITDNGEVYWLENNIDEDPLFCDTDNGDYRLQLDSPCRTDVCGFMGYTGETCEGESVDEQASVPAEFGLKQNYPNPFNPTTTIEYSLATPGDALLSVYNINGQLVDVIQEEFVAAGYHTATWTPVDLPSGVYFLELRAGEQRAVRKMIFVR